MYDARPPGLTATLILAGMSLVTLVLGWRIFGRLSRRFAEEL
jgi:hypothetical protein